MRRAAFCLAILPLTAAAQEAPVGVWTCLAPDGGPAFAFALLDPTHYSDPAGIAGEVELPEPGVLRFTTGTWAESGGSYVPGIMALMLPGAQVPVICTAGG